MALKELSCSAFELCLSLVSSIITIIIVVKLRRSVRVKSKENIVNLPPSPRKLPIIGNLHQIGALPYRSFKGLSDKHGDVMLLQLGHIPTVVVSSAQVVNEIMKGHDLALSNRGQSRATNALLYGSNDIGFANYGERWKQKRKICVRELLSPKMVESEWIRLVREGAVAELVDKDMFAAGSETTSVTVEWAMSELMKNPIELKKVQEEVRRVVGQKSNVEESKVKQMEYLNCVVKETLRLHPPAPLLVPRVATRHVNLGGYDIPANTRLYVNVWAIQRDPQVWDAPEEFIPERHRHSHTHTQDFKLIPFGFGRRGCPGINFGLASVEYMLANLLYYFNWESPQAIDMTEIFGLVASKRLPLHLKPIPFSFK